MLEIGCKTNTTNIFFGNMDSFRSQQTTFQNSKCESYSIEELIHVERRTSIKITILFRLTNQYQFKNMNTSGFRQSNVEI